MMSYRDMFFQVKDAVSLCPFQETEGEDWFFWCREDRSEYHTERHRAWLMHQLAYHDDFYIRQRRRRGGDISREQWKLLSRLALSFGQLEADLRLSLWDAHCEILPPTRAVYVRLRFWKRNLDSGEISWDWVLNRYLFYPGRPGKKLLLDSLNTRLQVERAAELEAYVRNGYKVVPQWQGFEGNVELVRTDGRKLH